MPIPNQERQVITVDEVDVPNRLVHARDKTNARMQVSWRDTGSVATAIPTSGERWTVVREGFIWYLENRQDTLADQELIETLTPGDTIIHTSGQLYFQGGSAQFLNTPLDIYRDSPFDAALRTFLNGETQPYFQLRDDGMLEWSDGVTGFDAQLYRDMAGSLRTESVLRIVRANNDDALYVRASGDTNPRLVIQGDGDIFWGPGNASSDVKLYRGGADILKTDDTFEVSRTAAGDSAHFTRVVGDSNQRLTIQADGKMLWGDGTAAPDVSLFRHGVNQLRTEDGLQFNRANAADLVLLSVIAAESVQKFSMDASGLMLWGPGGGSAQDTNLYREDLSKLKTDDRFISQTLHATGAAPAVPVEGESYYDTATKNWLFWNGKFWQPMHQNIMGGQHVLWSDDFLGAPVTVAVGTPEDNMFWVQDTSGTGSAVTVTDSTGLARSPIGVLSLQTGTTAAGWAYLATRHNIVQTTNTDLDLVYYSALVYIDVLSVTASNRFVVGCGITDSVATPDTMGSDNAIAFRYSDNLSSGAWQCNTADSDGSVTTHFTGSTVVADTWYLLELLYDRVAQTLKFWENGTLLGTLSSITPGSTADFPSAFSMRHWVGIQKTVGTTERTVYVDQMSGYMKTNASRF